MLGKKTVFAALRPKASLVAGIERTQGIADSAQSNPNQLRTLTPAVPRF
jgi:hypothetical protein